MRDKDKGLDSLARYLGMFEADNRQGVSSDLAALIREMFARGGPQAPVTDAPPSIMDDGE